MNDAPNPDDLDELAAAVDAWLAELTTLAMTLREMQTTMLPVDFEAWIVAAGLDMETADDFVAFDGTLESVTDRMLAAMQRIVAALS